jgi:ubiquinone/menaquinone biosynthesis C-methylase UbiE
MSPFRRRDRGSSTAPPAGRDDESDWRSYEAVAETYARVHSPRTALVAKDLVALARVGTGTRVLDVGTGTGVGAEAAARAGAVLAVGIDPAVSMLLAGVPTSGARLVAATAIDLPFRNGSFDVVLSCFSLSHVRDYKTALFDMLRVLRPEGKLAVAVWAEDEDEFSRTWSGVAQEFAEKELLQDARSRAMPWADYFSDPNRLKDTLHEAGLRDMVVEREQYRFPMSGEDYVSGREALTTGRFLKQMLGEELWEVFRRRARQVFAERFPERFNDFRDVILVVGIKP